MAQIEKLTAINSESFLLCMDITLFVEVRWTEMGGEIIGRDHPVRFDVQGINDEPI